MKKAKIIITGLFAVFIGLVLVLFLDRQSAYNQLSKANQDAVTLSQEILEGRARSNNEIMLDDVRGRIDSKKADREQLTQELSQIDTELGVLYQSIPALKEIIKKEVEERNGLTEGL